MVWNEVIASLHLNDLCLGNIDSQTPLSDRKLVNITKEENEEFGCR